MNRFYKQILAVALLLSCCACSAETTDSNTDASPSASSKQNDDSDTSDTTTSIIEETHVDEGTTTLAEHNTDDANHVTTTAAEPHYTTTTTKTTYVATTDDEPSMTTTNKNPININLTFNANVDWYLNSDIPYELPEIQPGYRHTPCMENYQVLFLDMSKRENFVFDGSFLEFEVFIPYETAPGIYPINFVHTDFANYDAQSLEMTVQTGYVCVDTETPDMETGIDDDFALTMRPVLVQPGDTVKLRFILLNNPGFVGFNLIFSYDSNALQIINSSAGKAFQNAVNHP